MYTRECTSSNSISSCNYGVTMIFFYQAYSPCALEWLIAQGKRSSEYQIKYISRPRTLVSITAQWKALNCT